MPVRRAMNFAGSDYDQKIDGKRLALQIERVRLLMLGGRWFSLPELKSELESMYAPARFGESSLSAQIRNLRKKPYCLRIEKRRRAGARPGAGIFEYRLLGPEPRTQLGLFRESLRRAEADVRNDEDPDDVGRENFFREARRIASQDSK